VSSAIDLRLGRWQEELADVECDALISDPPYDARTHLAAAAAAAARPEFADNNRRRNISYAAWSDDDARDFVAFWAPRTRGWMVIVTSHALYPTIAGAMEQVGRYVFAPLPFYSPGSRVRLAGDGPSNWTCWIVVSRPRARIWQTWGTLPGGYAGKPEAMEIVGGKPLWLMRNLVSDYSRPGDLVCDPCAGMATALLAAAMEGRRAIGAEMDPVTFAKAQRRIAAGYTPDLFVSQPGKPAEATQ
jgi:site-specific DNA-methyltransferase (adenine-specific)